MNDIAELVDLPEPAVQPLVHPLDLPEARRRYRRSWLVGQPREMVLEACVAELIHGS